jgi:hypothetical protein
MDFIQILKECKSKKGNKIPNLQARMTKSLKKANGKRWNRTRIITWLETEVSLILNEQFKSKAGIKIYQEKRLKLNWLISIHRKITFWRPKKEL